MIVFLNGEFLPEDKAVVSIFDRGFTLGDALFETLPVYEGKPFLWHKHFARLTEGAAFLHMRLPYSSTEARKIVSQLLERNHITDGVLRLQLSRGVGPRGYSIQGVNSPTFVMTLHPPRNVPSSIRLITSSVRIMSGDPIGRFKSCQKLGHVLARIEADEQGADEALLLNANGNVAEAASANLFWVEEKSICTTPLGTSALAGVTREKVMQMCRELNHVVVEKNILASQLLETQGAFLTASTIGIIPVSLLDHQLLPLAPVIAELQKAYAECSQRWLASAE